MNNSSGPVDYPSLVLCLGVYLEHIFLSINVGVLLQWLEVLTAFVAFLYNFLKLIEWIKTKFLKPKNNAKKTNPTDDV